MKPLNIIPIVLIAAFLLQIVSLHAQKPEGVTLIITDNEIADCTNNDTFESDREPINTILEEDYPFLKSIQCLKSRELVKSRGWNLKLKTIGAGQTTHYELHGKGRKIEVKATYDLNGNLEESWLSTKDIRIPPAIRQFVYSDEYEGWTVIGNEKIVKDFDPYQTEYNIILSDGSTEQVLNFKEFGNTIAFSGIVSRDEGQLESILSY